ncbi:hypothetical protein [Streptomyces sp. CAI-85]|uniref:hypothetical protein n=1 Tax=Streptomyces sp. CAI-85 TaxID=1472662 RepID=UPI001587AD57|nr:hypothetical protein [Streptomyces sp. CAI-85]NUV58621.1 hypothetical protein [Streptomyces sp. CAI-85]
MRTAQGEETAAALQFIGIDPNTGDEYEKHEIPLKGWKAAPELEAECAAFEAPGHAVGVPEHEAVIRFPARMAPTIREACDAVERTTVQ